jgi:hypothetical protein
MNTPVPLLPGGAVTVAGGGVVEQRVRRWRQHRGRVTLLRHMVAESLRRWTKQNKNVSLAVTGGGVSRGRASAAFAVTGGARRGRTIMANFVHY